ncbi:thymidine phosphorylase family protein [Thiomonas sp. FB-6]|uniref:thymidine phosphorylase family protein n=1 Tax=Thiomonas sp. FB-6 TaxID=1158291 RepID=UPI00047793A1|nr:thymidine phosphorylase family protein [Thiomonas sp. FB-6]
MESAEPRDGPPFSLRPRRLGVDTHHEPVVVLRADSPVVRAEGFEAHARIEVLGERASIVATLNILSSGGLLGPDEVGLSEAAWARLQPGAGERLRFRFARPSDAMSHVRAKIFGKHLSEGAFEAIIGDTVAGRLSNVEIAAFLVACAAGSMSRAEVNDLTRAMVHSGARMSWPHALVVDKHCIGGLPGNRTTPIVVSIATALGLIMPKTSSRAITSPAGTADTLETITCVDLDLARMRRVVEAEGGCMVWGGAMNMSPADDLLIRVERMLDLDSEAQLVASVLSKKAAAGSTHVVIDIPTGPTAKVRSAEQAQSLLRALYASAHALGLRMVGLISDGSQPVGRGVGPALEAHDVLRVLRRHPQASTDLRERSLDLAAAVIELGGLVPAGGTAAARELAAGALDDGRALRKFQAICEAQGAFREPGVAPFQRPVPSPCAGRVQAIDNRLLARAAKLAGAPHARSAGLLLGAHVGERVERGQPLFELHAESQGELDYALDFVQGHPGMFHLEAQ